MMRIRQWGCRTLLESWMNWKIHLQELFNCVPTCRRNVVRSEAVCRSEKSIISMNLYDSRHLAGTTRWVVLCGRWTSECRDIFVKSNHRKERSRRSSSFRTWRASNNNMKVVALQNHRRSRSESNRPCCCSELKINGGTRYTIVANDVLKIEGMISCV